MKYATGADGLLHSEYCHHDTLAIRQRVGSRDASVTCISRIPAIPRCGFTLEVFADVIEISHRILLSYQVILLVDTKV